MIIPATDTHLIFEERPLADEVRNWDSSVQQSATQLQRPWLLPYDVIRNLGNVFSFGVYGAASCSGHKYEALFESSGGVL